MKTINITLVKSLIGRLPKHKEIAKQLGLTKINAKVEMPNNPAIMGLVNKIAYLVKVEESAK
ncbi:MAG TPA: 50S ribosomal protein L30 [Legionellaceae bacterium]|nr:50S ribosomal protein L30 [Legionellaceae bacterium]